MMMNRFVLSLFVGLTFFGCAFSQNDSPAQLLLGTWQFEDSALGALTLTFKKDYTYGVDYNSDGNADITGEYHFFSNYIKMTDHDPRVKTDCYESGLYDYVIDNNRIEFKRFADQCRPRKYILGYPFVRKNLEK